MERRLGVIPAFSFALPAPGDVILNQRPSTMRISLIVAHPAAGSFNHAIAAAAREQLIAEGHAVAYHDLYAERFDPLITPAELTSRSPIPAAMAAHCEEAATADGFVIVHPNWWGQPPAILKGWVDRVLRAGVAYRFVEGDDGEGVPVGLLRARAAIIFNTSNTPPEREKTAFGDPLELLWKQCILTFAASKPWSGGCFPWW